METATEMDPGKRSLVIFVLRSVYPLGVNDRSCKKNLLFLLLLEVKLYKLGYTSFILVELYSGFLF